MGMHSASAQRCSVRPPLSQSLAAPQHKSARHRATSAPGLAAHAAGDVSGTTQSQASSPRSVGTASPSAYGTGCGRPVAAEEVAAIGRRREITDDACPPHHRDAPRKRPRPAPHREPIWPGGQRPAQRLRLRHRAPARARSNADQPGAGLAARRRDRPPVSAYPRARHG